MKIPESVRELLWEYQPPGSADDPGWERAAMERVMARGLWADMQWLLACYGRDRLRRFLYERGRRVLPPRELRFWGTVCHVADQELDAWVTAAREREREWRG